MNSSIDTLIYMGKKKKEDNSIDNLMKHIECSIKTEEETIRKPMEINWGSL